MPNPPALEIILQAALEIPSLQERAVYLDVACAGDHELREEAESLIAAHFADETFMSSMADPLWHEARGEREGDMIGRYKLLKQIGEGGFGTVFLAEQSAPVKRQVALKVIKPGMDSREIIARFEAERQALALMDHPHIAKVHDAGTTDGGRPYFVMELVEGVPITKYCANEDLDTRERLELFTDVCAAVQHAHQKGIIHRDLKPSNILVMLRDGRAMVKVIDFGIAKAIGTELTEKTFFTQLGRMIGTPQYMSPEQAELNALNVDTRSDIYSLGVVLYELLTGTTPLDDGKLRNASYSEIQRLIREETPLKPSARIADSVSSRALRGDLDWIVLKTLEKDPSRRYESAGAIAEDLLRFLQHKPVEARPPSMTYLMLRFTRRHRGPVIASAALLLTLLLGTVGTTLGMKRALDAKAELIEKNVELVDYKERLAGLLESNQKMLGEIRRMSTSEEGLPTEFEALQKENQTLLDKVKNEVANQERYAEEIEKLKHANAQLEKLAGRSKGGVSFSAGAAPKTNTGGITVPHSIVTLTPEQIDETQTLGTLTLTPGQWREIRTKSPQCPKRFDRILPLPMPDQTHDEAGGYAIELSRDRIGVPHHADSGATVESVRARLFKDMITSLRVNERGEFHFDGKLIPFQTLLKAFATPLDDVKGDESEETKTEPRWLKVKLPAGAKPTDAVYHSRLSQLAAAADQIGIRHQLPPRQDKAPQK